MYCFTCAAYLAYLIEDLPITTSAVFASSHKFLFPRWFPDASVQFYIGYNISEEQAPNNWKLSDWESVKKFEKGHKKGDFTISIEEKKVSHCPHNFMEVAFHGISIEKKLNVFAYKIKMLSL